MAQLRLGIPKSILTFDIGYLKSNVRLGQQNNSLSTMIRGRMIGIKIAQSPKDQLEWSIERGNHAICTFLYARKADRLILKFNNYKRNSTRDKVATWYNKLTQFVENGAVPLADKSIRECRYWTFIEAYLNTITVKSKIKKKNLLLILPQEFDKALTLGQIYNKGKADKNRRFEVKKVIIMAADILSMKKLVIDRHTTSLPPVPTRIHYTRIQIIRQYKTDKSIYQDWKDICDYEEKEVIDKRGNLLNISTMTPEIAITGYDVWIEKWLDDSTLQESLMRTKSALQEGWKSWNEPRANQRIEIYTNRSLTKTQTEICAILIALMAVPELAQVVIYTDNQCAINDITTWNKKSVWAKEKTTNHCILFRIAQIVREKMINLEVIKEKGHLNIAGNEEADKLMAEGSNSNVRFTYRIDHSRQDFRCLACQNDNVEDWKHLLDCQGYDEVWNAIHNKLTIEFKLIGQKELKDDKAMLIRLNSAIT
ncbi:ribonuclease HI [Rhizophagus clarus]|uniref:Ribonuclease HI n=1 Tax=Rhizophagus clarus TaxID=94130 RepID=A0A8H3QLH3_9GLOM|nr:ribonuclease HI [Rhizophagus clarus]